jgi:hypothetical protein
MMAITQQKMTMEDKEANLRQKNRNPPTLQNHQHPLPLPAGAANLSANDSNNGEYGSTKTVQNSTNENVIASSHSNGPAASSGAGNLTANDSNNGGQGSAKTVQNSTNENIDDSNNGEQ